MSNSQTFRTKTGYCHICEDKIVLSREKDSNATIESSKNRIGLTFLFYGLLSVFMLYHSYDRYVSGHIGEFAYYGTMGLIPLILIITSRNLSSTNLIWRNSIKKIEYRSGTKFVTRSRFLVTFEDEKGQIKKRFIFLPGSLSNGESATAEALEIMKEEKLVQSMD